MGQNNRQRRAAKQRERSQKYRDHSTHPRAAAPGADREGPSADPDETAVARSLLSGLLRRLIQGGDATSERLAFQRCDARHQQATLDELFASAVQRVITAGWTPVDLYEVVRRKSTSPAITHLLDVVAAVTAEHPAHLIDRRWRAQLDALGAAAPRTQGVSPCLAWGHRSGLDWAAAANHLVDVLVVMCAVPAVERVLPAPGQRAESRDGESRDGESQGGDGGVDAKVLHRVRALLAKAESTEHPEEADALTAKAQELMTRYSIERAVAESTQPFHAAPVSRRLWLDNPYVDAKALLVDVVAEANNCRAIQAFTWGFVSIVGHSGDLDLVELLVTSLLLQATRAMNQAGPQLSRSGASRTRSFRQSFLVAYAGRIGERLRESTQTTETTYDRGHGGTLVPVLAARREAVQDTVAELFPTLVQRTLSSSNAAGWGAGRSAADRAQFDVRDAVRSRAG